MNVFEHAMQMELDGKKYYEECAEKVELPQLKQVLMELLELSIRSPSSINIQPWEFYIISGDALNELKSAYLKEFRLGRKADPEIPVVPKGGSSQLQGVFRERQVKLAKQIFKIMNIGKGDSAKQQKWNEKMMRFYDAPAVIVIVVDKTLQGSWPILDTGLVLQNIVLAAQEYGLGTCIMRVIVDYPEQLRKIAKIPETKRIVIGLSIGYPDNDHPVNQLKTDREEIEKIVTIADSMD